MLNLKGLVSPYWVPVVAASLNEPGFWIDMNLSLITRNRPKLDRLWYVVRATCASAVTGSVKTCSPWACAAFVCVSRKRTSLTRQPASAAACADWAATLSIPRILIL